MAKNNVYALFVGVDLYDIKSGISPLSGCVNDAKRMLDYLDENIDRAQYNFDKKTHAVTLFSDRGNTDKSMYPTRDNILKYFKEHLIANVKKDDYAIFFYAGHGTTEPAHPYFKEPTGKVQALVPYDARTPAKNEKGERIKVNGKDVQVRCVLDKEVRFLIRKLWEKSGSENIIFIQDSCHSAGASRAEDAVGAIVSAMNTANENIGGIEVLGEDTTKKVAKSTINSTTNSSTYPQELLAKLSDSDRNVLKIYKNGPPKGSDLANKIEKLMAEITPAEQEKEEAQNENATIGTALSALPEARFLSPDGASPVQWETEEGKALAQIRSLYTGFREDAKEEEVQSRSAGGNSTQKQPFDVAFPQGNHLHMAACSSSQYAYEVKHIDPVTQQAYRGGVFTNTILSLLKKSKNNISYHDLFNRAKLSIDGVFKQTPDMYIKGDTSKRFGFFLGDTIKREGTDSNTYNLIDNSKEGLCIDAGELQGLPRIEGKISFIPAYVYPLGADESDLEGATANAYLTEVLAQKSMLAVDPKKVDAQGEPLLKIEEDKLYKAYISPKWHRRRRVRIALAQPEIKHNIKEHISNVASVELTNNLQEANYSIKAEKGSYHLYKVNNGQETLLNTLTAFMETITTVSYAGEQKKESATVYFKKIAAQHQLADSSEQWKYANGTTETPLNTTCEYAAGYCEQATNAAIQFLLDNTESTSAKVMVHEMEQINPFQAFKTENSAQLSYYNMYINWIDNPAENVGKIDYFLGYNGARYFVYAAKYADLDNKVPAFKQTKDLSNESAWELISGLQHMTKWYTLAGFKNKIQTAVFQNRDLSLQLRTYQRGGASEGAPHLPVNIDLQQGIYSKVGTTEPAKPLFSKEEKGIRDENIFFLRNKTARANQIEGYYQESVFKYDLVFTNSEKANTKMPDEINQKLFVSMVIMDDNYGVTTMQSENGCEAVPMRALSNTNDDGKGQITRNNIYFDMPQAMKDNKEVKDTQMLIKVFVAFASFDISKYLQESLEPAIDFSQNTYGTSSSDGDDKTRGLVNVRPRSADPGGWAAFHVPVVINRDAPVVDTSIENEQPDGLDEEEEDFDF